MAYFNLLQHFGGVPIIDHVLDVNDDVLYGPRKSRYEVFNFLVADLRKSIELLPKETAIAAADKGRISKEAAQAYLGRVLLYEATWESMCQALTTTSMAMVPKMVPAKPSLKVIQRLQIC